MEISEAIKLIDEQKDKPKYEAMIMTASIITKLLEKYRIQPIIVGGLSVEIYTQNEYATRDVDFVSDGFDIIRDILLQLGFTRDERHFFHEEIEVAVEIPDNYLAGDYNKVVKVEIDENNYVYLISIEDIIMDRLRASVAWDSAQDAEWGIKLLNNNKDAVDIDYMFSVAENKKEVEELSYWLEELGITREKVL